MMSDGKISSALPVRAACLNRTNPTLKRKLKTFPIHLLPLLSLQEAQYEDKLQAYSEVCKNFKPVFRYFCMERFLDPAVWMEKRLAYTRSVATSSIGTDSTVAGCSVRSLLTSPVFDSANELPANFSVLCPQSATS